VGVWRAPPGFWLKESNASFPALYVAFAALSEQAVNEAFDAALAHGGKGIDRLGRNAAEVMATIRELRDRDIVLRSLREGIDSSNATGRMVAGVLASLAERELELGRERRAAAREA
jgi:hypothetical protein